MFCLFYRRRRKEFFLDHIKDDQQLQEYIDENEKIIEKYHRKINEIFQLIREQGDEIDYSPIAIDYKKLEDEEKRLCDEKKKKLIENQMTNEQIISDDKGVYL